MRALAGWLVAVAAAAIACANPPDPTPTPERWTPARCAEADALEAALRAEPDAAREGAEPAGHDGEGTLRVRLAFHGPADLDLWVTDPSQESVYYFNREARSGGTLDVDRGCDGDGASIETIRFAQPLPGRHRIGVDHPRHCDGGGGGDGRVFVVSVDDGRSERWVRGIVPLGVFRAIQHEFAWPLVAARAGGGACASPSATP